jgi:hypothetical protein
VLNPLTCKAVYDVLPALTGSPTYVSGVMPCADGAHLVVLTGTAPGGFPTHPNATRWHILSLSASAATEIANGPWTGGPEQMQDSDNFSSTSTIPMGCSSIHNNVVLGSQNSHIVGMLESDLQHLWIVCSSGQFYCLSLTAGNNYSVVFHGLGGRNGPNQFVKWDNLGEFSPFISMYADQGEAAGFVDNSMALWTRMTAGPQEIDVAKEAIAGDTSWRTIFCGFDVPRFTDLGLASGLTSGGNPVTGSSTVALNAGPYPIYYRKLGVSNPTLPPASVAVGPNPNAAVPTTITETFDNPTQWNLPANGPNTGSDFLVVGGNPGACMLVQSIGAREAIAWKNFPLDQTSPLTMAIDFTFIRAFNARLTPSIFDFFVGLDSSLSGTCIRIENVPAGAPGFAAGGVILHFASVSNGVIGADIGTFNIQAAAIPTWHVDADPTFTGFIQAGTWDHVTIVVTPQTGATTAASIAFTVKQGATTVFTQTQAGMPIAGPGAGVGTFVPVESYPDWLQMKVDNLQMSGQGTAAGTSNLESTTYLYTLVNDLGEESGPSPAMVNADGSNFITRPIGQAVGVALPGSLVASGADQTYFQVNPGTFIPPVQLDGVTASPTMNVYRAVTGTAGTQFLLVAANVPFGGLYVVTAANPVPTLVTSPPAGAPANGLLDQMPDSALAEVIPSLFTVNGVQGFWSPPPVDMLGILALPNQIYAGFTGNILCLSVQAIPHAWPIIYQLIFDYDIVGIEAVDVSIVVCTRKFPYFVSGNTPDQMSSTKATYPYACASKRSVKFLKGVGVVYSTFEGLVAIAGPGQERVLTENLFSKREWLLLNPTSFIAEVNDGRYFCSYTTVGGAQGAFYIDVMDQGSGKVSLGWHFTARYNDPLSDILYIVPDFVDPLIPIGLPLQQIAAFEQLAGSPLPYVWKSKQYYVNHPTCWKQARIQAESFVSLVLTLFADGVQYAQITVASNVEFALPPPSSNGTSPGTINKYFEFQIASPDFVDRVQFVEDPEEWAVMA